MGLLGRAGLREIQRQVPHSTSLRAGSSGMTDENGKSKNNGNPPFVMRLRRMGHPRAAGGRNRERQLQATPTFVHDDDPCEGMGHPAMRLQRMGHPDYGAACSAVWR